MITPHKLRATYAMDMLDATGDLDLVRENLGHSDPKTTTIYAKTSEAKRKQYRNVLME
jgi:site-specific recombinase XerC